VGETGRLRCTAHRRRTKSEAMATRLEPVRPPRTEDSLRWCCLVCWTPETGGVHLAYQVSPGLRSAAAVLLGL
jgi:hypothetical protein